MILEFKQIATLMSQSIFSYKEETKAKKDVKITNEAWYLCSEEYLKDPNSMLFGNGNIDILLKNYGTKR